MVASAVLQREGKGEEPRGAKKREGERKIARRPRCFDVLQRKSRKPFSCFWETGSEDNSRGETYWGKAKFTQHILTMC